MKSTPIIMPKAVKIERQFIMKVGLRLTLITLKKRNHWIKKSETSPGSKWGCWFNNKAPSLLFHWTVSSISWLIVRFLLSGELVDTRSTENDDYFNFLIHWIFMVHDECCTRKKGIFMRNLSRSYRLVSEPIPLKNIQQNQTLFGYSSQYQNSLGDILRCYIHDANTRSKFLLCPC